jgi:hypothetical protein
MKSNSIILFEELQDRLAAKESHLSRPFEGIIRVSAQPLRHALEVINHLKPNLP